MASRARENPAALKYALCLPGLMRPDTRLQIVELADSAKTEVANVIEEIGDDDPTRSWQGTRSQSDVSRFVTKSKETKPAGRADCSTNSGTAGRR
jgi:hypothetical protein